MLTAFGRAVTSFARYGQRGEGVWHVCPWQFTLRDSARRERGRDMTELKTKEEWKELLDSVDTVLFDCDGKSIFPRACDNTKWLLDH